MANVRANWHVRAPTRLDSLLFLALMSGPPKFRARDITASLSGEIDSTVLIQVGVWACGGLWVFARLYPSVIKRGIVPALNTVQVIGALLIGVLCVSLWRSPGFLLTAFMLGQFAVMLSFAWVFAHRFGSSTYLRHLFAVVCALTLIMAAVAFLAPNLVFLGDAHRFRGDGIAPVGPVAAMGLVFCLSNVPPLRFGMFWLALTFFGVLLAASQTRTAYIAFLVYLAVGYIFGRRLPVRKLVPLLAALSLSLLLLDALAPTTDYIVRDTQSLETMSDRLPLWKYLTTAVMSEEPLTGLGYYAASRVLAPAYNPNLGNAHSAFFEIVVGGGILAAALYLLLCALLVRYAGRLLDAASGQPDALAAVGLLAVALVQGITSSEGLNGGPLGFTFWSMTALLPAMYREAASRAVLHTQRLQVRRPMSRVQPATADRSFL
jgi:exopolysaccharide production protein ExoQ